MTVFNNLVKIDNDGNIQYNGWVKWLHISKGFTHCNNCLGLDNCWFLNQKRPQIPLHENCHCKLETISEPSLDNTTSNCKIEKFTHYVFAEKYKEKGKEGFFTLIGFDIDDSEYLKAEFEKQAKEQYIKGNYELKKLDENGQRIRIPIDIKTPTKTYNIFTGWMVYPNGHIQLTTPFTGKNI